MTVIAWPNPPQNEDDTSVDDNGRARIAAKFLNGLIWDFDSVSGSSQTDQDTKIADLETITPDDVDETFFGAVNDVDLSAAWGWSQAAWDAVKADLASSTVQRTATLNAASGEFTMTDVGGGNPNVIQLAAQAAQSSLPPMRTDIRDAATSSDLELTSELAQRTELDLKLDKAETEAAIPTNGSAVPTKWANEKAVYDLFVATFSRLGIGVTAADWGQFSGNTIVDDRPTLTAILQDLETKLDLVELLGDRFPSVATFAELATTHTTATENDWSFLSVQDGTNPPGAYVFDGTDWSIAFEIASPLAGVIADFDDATEKAIAKTWKAETLDRRNADLWGTPLPDADGPLSLGRRYFGETTRNYTHPNPGPDDPNWIEVVNVSAAGDGDPISVEAEGDVVRADNGQSIDGPIGVPPGYFYRAFWVASSGKWHVEANRDQSLVWTTADAGKTLAQRTFTTIYQGALGEAIYKVPDIAAGYIEFRYHGSSSGPIRLEQQDLTLTPQRLFFNGIINNHFVIGTEHKGKLIRLEVTEVGGNTYWSIEIEGLSTTDQIDSWEPNKAYSTGNRVVVSMPINADWITDDGSVVGVNYIIEAVNDRPDTVTVFDDVEADSGGWKLIGAFRVSGNDLRTMTGTGTQALSINDINYSEAKRHIIPDGATQDYLFTHNPSLITVFDDLLGTVTATIVDTASSRAFSVSGPAEMIFAKAGNAAKFTFVSNSAGSPGFNADMLDLASGDHGFTFDAANSGTTPTNTTKAVGGIGIRPVQANFTAAAQRHEWPITKDGDIAVYIPKHTVTPITLQVGETATPANLYGVDVALDGTLSQPVGQPTNQLTGMTATKFDNDEWWKIVLSGTRPTNVTLKVWGNDIGDGSDFEDIQYAFEIDSQFSPDFATQSFVRRENVAAAGGEWVGLGGGLEIRAGGDNNTVNYPRLRVNDGVVKRISAETWYHASDTAEASNRTILIERLAIGEEWNAKENAGYNLQANYIQFLIVKEPGTGREWNVEYTVQPGDASIVLNSTYKAGDIVSIPDATAKKAEVNITVNGGVNGTKQIIEGAGAVSFILTSIPAGQIIDTATFEASALPAGVTAVVRDETVGAIAIEVADGTGNVDIAVPFKARTILPLETTTGSVVIPATNNAVHQLGQNVGRGGNLRLWINIPGSLQWPMQFRVEIDDGVSWVLDHITTSRHTGTNNGLQAITIGAVDGGSSIQIRIGTNGELSCKWTNASRNETTVFWEYQRFTDT